MICFIRFIVSAVLAYTLMAIEVITYKLNGNKETPISYPLVTLAWRLYQKMNCSQYRQLMDDGLGPEITEYFSRNE